MGAKVPPKANLINTRSFRVTSVHDFVNIVGFLDLHSVRNLGSF